MTGQKAEKREKEKEEKEKIREEGGGEKGGGGEGGGKLLRSGRAGGDIEGSTRSPRGNNTTKTCCHQNKTKAMLLMPEPV